MERLLKILKNVREDIDFEKTENLIDGGILESLDIMVLVTEISDEFSITLSPVDIVPANFNSAKAMWKMIESKLNG